MVTLSTLLVCLHWKLLHPESFQPVLNEMTNPAAIVEIANMRVDVPAEQAWANQASGNDDENIAEHQQVPRGHGRRGMELS